MNHLPCPPCCSAPAGRQFTCTLRPDPPPILCFSPLLHSKQTADIKSDRFTAALEPSRGEIRLCRRRIFQSGGSPITTSLQHNPYKSQIHGGGAHLVTRIMSEPDCFSLTSQWKPVNGLQLVEKTVNAAYALLVG